MKINLKIILVLINLVNLLKINRFNFNYENFKFLTKISKKLFFKNFNKDLKIIILNNYEFQNIYVRCNINISINLKIKKIKVIKVIIYFYNF